MNAADERFRRLLRWYPRSWRAQNGDVFVATLIEAAEHQGRSAPTSADAWGAALHGTAARLTARLALVLSVAALSLSVVAGVGYVWALNSAVAGTLVLLLAGGIIPVLTAVAVVALSRDRGLVDDARVIVLIALTVLAVGFAALAGWSWSLGFDAADAGTAAPPLAEVWLPLVGAALIFGVGSFSLFFDSLFARTTLSRSARIPLAIVASCVVTPFAGYALLTPYVGAGVALVVAVLAASPRRAPAVARQPWPASPAHGFVRSAPVAEATTIRVLALVATLGGSLGIVYALTGARWAPAAGDGTAAMAQGVTLLFLAALPLLAAFGVWSARRSAQRPRHVWEPLALVAVALLLLAAAYTHAPEWDAMAPWLFAGSAVTGGAISWWIAPRTRLPRPAAAILAVFPGLLYAAFLGILVGPVLAFAVPILGILLIVGARSSRLGSKAPHIAKEPVHSSSVG